MIKNSISSIFLAFAVIFRLCYIISFISSLLLLILSFLQIIFNFSVLEVQLDFGLIILYLVLLLILQELFSFLSFKINPVEDEKGTIVMQVQTPRKLCSNCGNLLKDNIQISNSCPNCNIVFGRIKLI